MENEVGDTYRNVNLLPAMFNSTSSNLDQFWSGEDLGVLWALIKVSVNSLNVSQCVSQLKDSHILTSKVRMW